MVYFRLAPYLQAHAKPLKRAGAAIKSAMAFLQHLFPQATQEAYGDRFYSWR
jgi:hypothetical protein